jgi:ribosome-associated heat shock protein Hsp15
MHAVTVYPTRIRHSPSLRPSRRNSRRRSRNVGERIARSLDIRGEGVLGPLSERQRIDRWLWHARVVRTRSAAAGLAAGGLVRVNGQRVNGASWPVRLGDIVTVSLDRGIRALKVVGFAERRGSADEARALYADLYRELPPIAG